MTLEKGLAAFLDAMLGKNRSAATLRAYKTDVLQFITFLQENNVAITVVGDIGKVDVGPNPTLTLVANSLQPTFTNGGRRLCIGINPVSLLF